VPRTPKNAMSQQHLEDPDILAYTAQYSLLLLLLPPPPPLVQVCVLEYDPGTDRLNAVASWVHPPEVWDLAWCPGQPGTFISVHSKGVQIGLLGGPLNAMLCYTLQAASSCMMHAEAWGSPQCASERAFIS
jgi:hypothetical protein